VLFRSFFLPYAFDLSWAGLVIFGVFYGFDWITTVPPTVRLTANIFGGQKAGMVYGWIMVVHQTGAAALAYGSGLLRTDTGDYFSAYMISGVLCLIAALLVLGIGKSSPQGLTPRPALMSAEA
jgi:sugar phosphate permease